MFGIAINFKFIFICLGLIEASGAVGSALTVTDLAIDSVVLTIYMCFRFG